MTRRNALVLAAFFAALTLFVLSTIAIDVWLYMSQPSGSTISWSMALLGQSSPMIVFTFGYVVGGITWGLAFHFWFGMVTPADWDELISLRSDNAKLQSQINTLSAKLAAASSHP